MSTRTETNTVYAAGLVQGIVLVTFPAASTVFTDPSEYDLSSSRYGAMFLPQVVTAVVAALLAARVAGRLGSKRVYLIGLGASLVSMGLLIASVPLHDGAAAYPLLLLATAFLGVGFGLTVPTLNTLTAAFHPEGVDRSVLVLNALLGLGTALAPIFVAVFVGLGFWWGLPVLSVVLIVGLLLVSRPLPLHAGARAAASGSTGRSPIPRRFAVYAGFAILYGICETLNGNWSQLDMTTEVGASTTVAALALTTFWAMVTVGRVLFAAIQSRFPSDRVYRLLPFVLVVAFVVIAVLPDGGPLAGVLAFGLAGLGCSALLPLTISFAQEDLVTIAGATSGLVIATYQVGYGLAAFGAGPLLDSGVTLPTIFLIGAGAAAVLIVLSFVIARPATQVTAVEPAPS